MKKRLKGFTLTEVMVSLVILTIVVTISSTMIISSLNLLLKNAFIRDAQNNGNEIYQLLEDKLRYSQHFRIISDEESEESLAEEGLVASYTETIEISKDSMRINSKDIYDKKQLKNADCFIRLKQNTPDNIQLTVELKREDELIYSKSGNVTLENADVEGKNRLDKCISNLDKYEEGIQENIKISIGYCG